MLLETGRVGLPTEVSSLSTMTADDGALAQVGLYTDTELREKHTYGREICD